MLGTSRTLNSEHCFYVHVKVDREREQTSMTKITQHSLWWAGRSKRILRSTEYLWMSFIQIEHFNESHINVQQIVYIQTKWISTIFLFDLCLFAFLLIILISHFLLFIHRKKIKINLNATYTLCAAIATTITNKPIAQSHLHSYTRLELCKSVHIRPNRNTN